MQAHIDTVKAAYACFAQGDIAGILAKLDPEIEWEHDWGGRTLKWYVPRKGIAAVPGFFEALADFEFVRFEPFAFLAGDGMVAVPVHLELIVKATGKRVRDLEMHLWTFGADGRITRLRHLCDTLQFAEAAG